jgi:hypothetical protein
VPIRTDSQSPIYAILAAAVVAITALVLIVMAVRSHVSEETAPASAVEPPRGPTSFPPPTGEPAAVHTGERPRPSGDTSARPTTSASGTATAPPSSAPSGTAAPRPSPPSSAAAPLDPGSDSNQ